MAVRVPVKALFREDGVVDALGEFVAGDYISVDDGGTGAVSFTADQVLVGNGTGALTTITRNNIIAANCYNGQKEELQYPLKEESYRNYELFNTVLVILIEQQREIQDLKERL